MGYGDELMASGEARAIKNKYPTAKVIVGDGQREIWSDIYEQNPNISRLFDIHPGDDIVWLKNYVGHRPYLDYEKISGPQIFLPYSPIPGDIYFTEKELVIADRALRAIDTQGSRKIYIEPNVDFGPVKDWGITRYQSVVNQLFASVSFIQPDYGKHQLDRVNLVSTENFRHACAILRHCDLYVGPEGGMHHAAAALGINAVVLFGGRVHPETTGYSFHSNLYIASPESPCGAFENCDHCLDCFDQILVEDVILSIRQHLPDK